MSDSPLKPLVLALARKVVRECHKCKGTGR